MVTTAIERKVQRPRWDGRPIPGKTLLIHDEQGFGDTFQFMRMAPWAKARSEARVILEVNAQTLPLAQPRKVRISMDWKDAQNKKPASALG